MSNQISRYVFAAVLLLCSLFAHAQTPVSMAPPIHFQFLNASGQPLANGKLYTYAAGTTSCQSTYADGLGVTANPCPIPLDATGSPSNGSTEVGVFLSNASYRFMAFDANNVFQWSVDNVNTFFALLNSANTWTATQTFSTQIVSTLTDNQMVFGTALNQTTLDFPPPLSNVTLHMPNSTDTMVGRVTTDTLQNKTLTAPVINNPTINGISLTGGIGSYLTLPNQTSTGTTLNTLTALPSGAAQAQIAQVSPSAFVSGSLFGILGICILNCGTTGTATIQQSGVANCVFDNTVTVNHYFMLSPTTVGNCHDSGYQVGGPPPPVGVYGIALAGGVAGTYAVDLFSPPGVGYCPAPNSSGNCVGTASASGNSSLGTFHIINAALEYPLRVSCYVVITTAATSSSTLPACTVTFQDANNLQNQTVTISPTSSGNSLTTVEQGVVFISPGGSGTITIQTSSYASSGTTAMSYYATAAILPD